MELRVSGREGCWGGSGETEFTPSGIRQFVSDHGARKMLPVVHVTGGPPSSRRRRRATFPLGTAVSYVPGLTGDARDTGAGRIGGSTSTATMMTMALTVLLVLVPAAYPDKISIGECCCSRAYLYMINVSFTHERLSRRGTSLSRRCWYRALTRMI